jgi:hypothetical protein
MLAPMMQVGVVHTMVPRMGEPATPITLLAFYAIP